MCDLRYPRHDKALGVQATTSTALTVWGAASSISGSEFQATNNVFFFIKKNQNAPRLSAEHPPAGGGNVKTFRWDHRLQIQNLFMTFKRVAL